MLLVAFGLDDVAGLRDAGEEGEEPFLQVRLVLDGGHRIDGDKNLEGG